MSDSSWSSGKILDITSPGLFRTRMPKQLSKQSRKSVQQLIELWVEFLIFQYLFLVGENVGERYTIGIVAGRATNQKVGSSESLRAHHVCHNSIGRARASQR